MTQLFEVDSIVLVEVGRRQRTLDAGDLITLDVQLAQHVVVALSFAQRKTAPSVAYCGFPNYTQYVTSKFVSYSLSAFFYFLFLTHRVPPQKK